MNGLRRLLGSFWHGSMAAATVMNSFFVPQLGGQIYTMGGIATHLNLLADQPGQYPGFLGQFRRRRLFPRSALSSRRCRQAISMPEWHRCAAPGSHQKVARLTHDAVVQATENRKARSGRV
jgi:hypothetical protein